jgi:hypothetical protein
MAEEYGKKSHLNPAALGESVTKWMDPVGVRAGP